MLAHVIKMTFRTMLDKPITTCIVCWPEEENKLSVVPAKKIVSPGQDDFAPYTFCKVKGFESHLCKIVAMGTVAEMIEKIRELEAGDESAEPPPTGDDTEKPPPKKKPRVKKASKGRKQRSGKENKNKSPSRPKKKEGKMGSIILVAAQQSENSQNTSTTSTASISQPMVPSTSRNLPDAQPSAASSSQPLQENTNITSAAVNLTHSQPVAPSTSGDAPSSTDECPQITNNSSAVNLYLSQQGISQFPFEPRQDALYNPFDHYLSDEETGSTYENENAEQEQGESIIVMNIIMYILYTRYY